MTHTPASVQAGVAPQDESTASSQVYRAYKAGVAYRAVQATPGTPNGDVRTVAEGTAHIIAQTAEGLVYRLCVQEFINGYNAVGLA